MSKQYMTAESVCAGHPDKLCDFIADSILDACLRKDRSSRVACEVMATGHKIIVAGEITCAKRVDIRFVVREALRDIGYNPYAFLIYVYVHKQSADIADGVDRALESRSGDTTQYSMLGAGDQGTVYGYATDETREYLPLPLVLAHGICKRVDSVRRDNVIKGIKPDGKAQVTIEYEDGKPKRVASIVVSVQHSADKDMNTLRSELISEVLHPVFKDFPFDGDTEILVNPSGRFVKGGPAADTGLTGRKLMVDTYGGLAAHGGGAFSGKDPTKVDRSGAYMARYIAKNLVWSGLAKRCEVALSYTIGKADPVAVSVNSFGTSEYSDERLCDAVKKVFCLRPAAIIDQLRLRSAIYADTAAYGHFNSVLFPWESGTDRYKELRKAVAEYDD
ncbi:MAG: methionine adenosyltransferase [Anaerotruncus rubiinfantis]|jgi:S-adenosylmethionine synthetase